MRARILFLTALFIFVLLPIRTARADATITNCSNQTQLAAALSGGGTITFNCGTATIPITSTLTVTTALIINGGGTITLDGGDAVRIINNQNNLTLRNITLARGRAQGANTAANGAAILSGVSSTLTLEGVTVRDNVANLTSFSSGSAYDFGGAVFKQGGSLTIRNSRFTNNRSTNSAGAAVHILRADLTVETSVFTGNQNTGGGYGGAIYIDGMIQTNGVVSITDSTFENNQSSNSGGAVHVHMYQNNDQITVNRSTFRNNRVAGGADRQGGAISGGNGRVTILNSLFTGNSVGTGTTQDGSGGAIAFAEPAVITIANTTITGNTAYGSGFNANGGGVYIINNPQPFQIINVTFANNTAGWVGGAITFSNDAPGVITNTIFMNNVGNNQYGIQQACSGYLTSGGGNMQFPDRNPNPNLWNEVTCAQGIPIQNANVQPLADNGGTTQTRALLPGSPAIGFGNATACANSPISGRDQRGVNRKTACDSGAFEFRSHRKTIGVYRPSAALFLLRNENTTGPANTSVVYGGAGYYPVVGDWNGDGIDTIGLYNQTTGQFLLRNTNTSGTPDYQFVLGNPNDTPLSGRWEATMTGDGAGVFRPSNGIIYLKRTLTTGFADYFMILGNPGDIGVAGDWESDQLDGPGVYRPSQGRFYLARSGTQSGIIFSDYALDFGANGDLPLAGDWTGQGRDGIGVFRASAGTIWLRNALTTGAPDMAISYGANGDIPIAGRWTNGAAPAPLSAVPNVLVNGGTDPIEIGNAD
jgi:predicted outer membrane repeat protein